MLKARIEVDLPGVEVLRSLGPIEWVQQLFGIEVANRTLSETTVSAWSLFEGLYRSFARAGVTDAVSYLVDHKAIYVDTQEVTHDLDLVRAAVVERGVLERPFQEMHLVLAAHADGLHLLFDTRVTARVVQGNPHVVVEISGRPEALRVAAGETAAAYAERVKALTADSAEVEQYLAALEAIAGHLAQQLEQDLPGGSARVEDARVQVVRPSARDVAKFRHLEFGEDVVAPQYRPTPSRARAGAYADPYVYYWYDPYWSFTNYLLLDAMVHDHHWHSPDVVVVDADGSTLFDGASAPADAGGSGWSFGDVSVGGGGIDVASSVSDAGWGGSDVGSGWGGSDTGDAGWGGSDVGGGSDGGGSDAGGSSCSSGSSCGSSCGGGCGGGGD